MRQDMKTRLSRRRLRAISEALHSRLAGEIEDVGDLTYEDYEAARDWADERLAALTMRKLLEAAA